MLPFDFHVSAPQRWLRRIRRWASSSPCARMVWTLNWVKRSSKTSTCQEWRHGRSEPFNSRYSGTSTRWIYLRLSFKNVEPLSKIANKLSDWAFKIYKGIFSSCAFSFTLSQQNIDNEYSSCVNFESCCFSLTEWRVGRCLSRQSVQLADSCDCHDEFLVYPHWPLSGNDWRNQGKPTTQVRNLLPPVFSPLLWFSFR